MSLIPGTELDNTQNFIFTADTSTAQNQTYYILFIAYAAGLATYWLLQQINRTIGQPHIYETMKRIPIVGYLLKKQLEEKSHSVVKGTYKGVIEAQKQWPGPSTLSKDSMTVDQLRHIFSGVMKPLDQLIRPDHVSGNIYIGKFSEQFQSFQGELMARTAYLNPLHADMLPIMPRMHANIMSICRDLFNAPSHVGGSVTAGGTFSIIEAVITYSLLARKILNIEKPNIIVPSTVHVAFDKAAEITNITLIKIPVDAVTRKADVKAMEQAINSNTVLLVGSAPNFMTGTVDNIVELGKLAQKHNIGLHVDSCLGGFITAFVDNQQSLLGHNCDFRVPGVTSISADPHKYGYCPKGVSVVLLGEYPTKLLGHEKKVQLGKVHGFAYANWPGGVYATLGMGGSRSLTPLATTLAVFNHLGRDYYQQTTKKIIELKEAIVDIIEIQRKSDSNIMRMIKIAGNPLLTVIAFESNHKDLNILQVAEYMKKVKQWDLNVLQNPYGFHICLTAAHLENPYTAISFCSDLGDAIAHAKNNPVKKTRGSTSIYCSRDEIPQMGIGFSDDIIKDIAREYLDILYNFSPEQEQPDGDDDHVAEQVTRQHRRSTFQ